jgi:hypothetical protein
MSPDFGTYLGNTTVPANTTAADVTLAEGSSTYIRVRAERGGTVSPWSTVQINPPTPLPTTRGPYAAPTNFVSTTVTDSSLTLAWTDNATAEWRFRIQRSTSASFNRNLLNLTVNANSTSWTDTTASPATQYYYRIRTELGSNVSPWVATTATTSSPTLPTAPANLAVYDEVYTPGTLDIQWTDNSTNETGFSLQRSTSPDFSADLTTISLPANTTTYHDTGLANWTTYYYRVAAKGPSVPPAPSTYSNTDSNRTADDGLRPPELVDNLPAADSGGWSSSTSGTGYLGSNFLTDNNQNKGNLTYRVYPPEGASPGLYYKIEVWYPAVTNAASNTKVAIDSDDPAVHEYQGRDELTLDQRTNTGQWITLGTKLNPYVEFSNANTDGVVSIDAVRFTPVDLQNTIIDIGPDQLSPSGWTQVPDPHALGGSYFSAPAFDPSIDDYAKYATTGQITPGGHFGQYELYVRYHAAPGNASNTPLHSEPDVLTPSSDPTLDQRTNGDRWVYVGQFASGFWNTPYVTLSNLNTNGAVTLDALLFRPLSFTT